MSVFAFFCKFCVCLYVFVCLFACVFVCVCVCLHMCLVLVDLCRICLDWKFMRATWSEYEEIFVLLDA